MKSLNAFFPWLEPWVLYCPTPAMLQALRDSAIDFCRDTRVLQVTTAPSPTVANQATYDIDLDTGTAVSSLISARYGAKFLNILGNDTADFYEFGNPSVSGEPRAASADATGVVRLYPPPDATATQALTFRVALRPTRSASSLSDVLFEEWVEAIAAGAAVRLAAIPGQPYTQASVVVLATQAFAQAKTRARIQAMKGLNLSSERVAARAFA